MPRRANRAEIETTTRPGVGMSELLGRTAEMFIEWVLSLKLPEQELVALLAIKRFERLGATFPSQKELAEMCRMDTGNFSRSLTELRKRGLIRSEVNQWPYHRHEVLWRPNDEVRRTDPPSK